MKKTVPSVLVAIAVIALLAAPAMADILIYSANPLEDVAIVADYDNNLKLIIKDGKVYKNKL